MKIYDFDPQTVPAPLLEAIGLYIVSSIHMENVIDLAIANLMGVDDVVGSAATTHMNNPQRIGTLRSLGQWKISDEKTFEAFENHVTAIREGLEKRNAFAHRQIAHDPETKEFFSVRQDARKQIKAELIPLRVDQIREEAVKLHFLGLKFLRFLHDAGVP